MYGLSSPDGGPIYSESNFTHIFPEPYNTVTSCLFTVLSIFWLLKLRKDYRKHIFLSVCTLILFIGSLGGSLYHGLRKYPVFLVMDYMPIMILCFMAGFYFLYRSFQNRYLSILRFCLYFLFIFGIQFGFPH